MHQPPFHASGFTVNFRNREGVSQTATLLRCAATSGVARIASSIKDKVTALIPPQDRNCCSAMLGGVKKRLRGLPRGRRKPCEQNASKPKPKDTCICMPTLRCFKMTAVLLESFAPGYGNAPATLTADRNDDSGCRVLMHIIGKSTNLFSLQCMNN